MPELPAPVSVQDGIRGSGIDIEVPDGEIRRFGPFDSYSDAYRIVEVTRFEELQELRIVPDDVSEQQAAEALITDETAAWEERNRSRDGTDGCSCRDTELSNAKASRRGVRHTNLAEILGASHRRSLATDDPAVLNVNHYLHRWFNRSARYLVGVASSQNIIIGMDAALVMSPTVHVVYANLIQMSSGSRLRFESGSVNVYCDTLNSPPESATPHVWGEIPYHPGPTPEPWELDDMTDLLMNNKIGKYLPGYWRDVRLRTSE